jgi:AmmeMemoRadiSam system protein B
MKAGLTATLITLWTLGALGCAGCKRHVPSEPGTSPPGEEGASVEAGEAQTPAAGEEEGAEIKAVYWSQVAGRFYPAIKEEVDELVTRYMKDASTVEALEGRDIVGFTSPHAGYVYSGPVAAWGYKQIQDRGIRTVVILGFNHSGSPGVSSLLPYDGYKTPLGTVPVDGQLRDLLLEKGKGTVKADKAPFSGEHSLETQIPFIQKVLPHASILPIMVAHPKGEVDEGLAGLLYDTVGLRKDVVIVASTDLSHYMPYDDAVSTDKETLGWLADLKWDEVVKEGPGANRMCGYFTTGVLVKMLERYGDKGAKGTLVRYANSGDTSGDKSKGVVGYGVVAFSLPEGVRTEEKAKAPAKAQAGEAVKAAKASPLSDEERETLTGMARESIRAALEGSAFDPEQPGSDYLRKLMGSIVVVEIDGRIHGTGKELSLAMPLYKSVIEAARSAVLGDGRYPTPAADKVPSMVIRIFAVRELEPMAGFKAEDYGGSDGLIIESPVGEGILLPDESDEQGWKDQEALRHGCRRANLMADCFKESNIKKEKIQFTAVKGGAL